MAFDGTDYQEADYLAVQAFFDATLDSNLDPTFDWQGFFGSAEDLETKISVPVVPGAGLPIAGGYYQLRYTKTTRAFSEAMFTRRALLDVRVRHQAGKDIFPDILAAFRIIKQRFKDLSTLIVHVDISGPVFPGLLRKGWPEWGILAPVWLS